MRFKVLKIAASAALAAGSTMASSAVITRTYTVNATDFGAGAPVDPVTGSFTLTFDDATPVTNETAGLIVNYLNLTLDSAVGYSFDSANLYLGGLDGGTFGATSASRDFAFGIFNAVRDDIPPASTNFTYSIGDGATFYSTFNSTVTRSAAAGAVPEPATWAMMIGGFGLAGGALRSRRRAELLAAV